MPVPFTPAPSIGTTDPPLLDGPAKNVGALRELLNARVFLRSAASGTFAWSGDFAVESGGSNSTFTVTLGAIQSLVLVAEDGSTYDLYFYAGGTIGASKIEGGGVLANSTRYYVYAKPGASNVCDFEIATTAPTPTRVYKGAGNTFPLRARRYLGTFLTTSAGAPIPCVARRGRYTYQISGVAAATLRMVHHDNTSGSLTTVALTSLVPSWARVVRVWLRAERNAATASAVRAEVRTAGDPGLALVTAAPNTSGSDSDNDTQGDVALKAAQEIEYQCSTSPAAGYGVSLWVVGFEE